MNITEELLRDVAPAVCVALSDALPAEEDCRHRFSFAFYRKMRPLLREQKGKMGHPVLRRVAAVFLAAMVGVGAWLTVDTDARAALLRWVKEVYETHIVYRFFGEDKSDISYEDYQPGWLPEGYVEKERYDLRSQNLIVYENEYGVQITFGVSVMKDGNATGVILEGAETEVVEVNGCPGVFYLAAKSDDQNGVIWVDENRALCFDLLAFEDKSVMMHIAESVYLTD